MHNNDSHEEKVEIVDLDTPGPSWQQQILRVARRLLARATPARSKILALALLSSIIVLLVVLQPGLPFAPHPIVQPTPSATPISEERPLTMSAANGIVYITGRDGSLTALGVLDGTMRWQIKSSGEAYYAPAASGQRVYIAVTINRYSMVEALQTSDGILLWHSQALSSAPLQLQIQAGIIYAGTQNGTLYAFDADTGRLLWHFASRQSTPMDGFFFAQKDTVTVSTANTIVYVLQAQSGKVLWHFQSDPQSPWGSEEDNGIYYYYYVSNNSSENGSLQAFSINTGKLLWQDTQYESTIDSLSAYNGVVYVDIRDGGMIALRGQDGKVLWHNPDVAALSSITVFNKNTLYLSSTSVDTLVGLRASDGKQLWQRKIDGLSQSAPMIDPGHDAIYLLQDSSPLSDKHMVQGWSISTGKLLWQFTLSSSLNGYLREVDGILYMQLSDDTMDVLRLSDGKLLWHFQG